MFIFQIFSKPIGAHHQSTHCHTKNVPKYQYWHFGTPTDWQNNRRKRSDRLQQPACDTEPFFPYQLAFVPLRTDEGATPSQSVTSYSLGNQRVYEGTYHISTAAEKAWSWTLAFHSFYKQRMLKNIKKYVSMGYSGFKTSLKRCFYSIFSVQSSVFSLMFSLMRHRVNK